jgi:hypothetical protein
MYFTAKKVYKLQANVDYKPGVGIIKDESDKPITAIHCIRQPESELVFRTMDGQVCRLPAEAFICGAIYPYEIRQVNEVMASCFVGLSE